MRRRCDSLPGRPVITGSAATLEGADDDGGDGTGGSGGTGGGGGGSGGGSGEGDELMRLDFTSLDDDERTLESSSFESDLGSEITEVARQIEGMAPNMKALTQ